jgi:hypothetical protein
LAVALGLGYPAMVAACVARLAEATAVTAVLRTGGHAEDLDLPGPVRPWLVLEGMARLAAAADGDGRPPRA